MACLAARSASAGPGHRGAVEADGGHRLIGLDPREPGHPGSLRQRRSPLVMPAGAVGSAIRPISAGAASSGCRGSTRTV
jgi:hypothetical protein